MITRLIHFQHRSSLSFLLLQSARMFIQIASVLYISFPFIAILFHSILDKLASLFSNLGRARHTDRAHIPYHREWFSGTFQYNTPTVGANGRHMKDKIVRRDCVRTSHYPCLSGGIRKYGGPHRDACNTQTRSTRTSISNGESAICISRTKSFPHLRKSDK